MISLLLSLSVGFLVRNGPVLAPRFDIEMCEKPTERPMSSMSARFASSGSGGDNFDPEKGSVARLRL